ncbi:MAG: DUF6531 domain-containing protein [Planctomycetota bacterium]
MQAASLTTYLPSGGTAVQGVRPLPGQRGISLDGSVRAGTPMGAAAAGNPLLSSGGCGSKGDHSGMLGPISLSTGTYVVNDVDLALPAPGVFRFVVGRSYNTRQDSSGHLDSNGPQGKNWFQSSMMELQFYDGDANKEATDYVYLVYGADRYIEFKRVADDSNDFRATNGAAGVIVHVPDGTSEPDLFKYTDQNGNQFWFFGVDADAGSASGQLWKILDTKDDSTPNVIYVGDAATASTAITSGFISGSGRLSKVYDAADRRYTYTYDGNNRLTQVKAETKTSGTWSSPSGLATVGQVDYTYYDGSTSYGSAGDLEFVKVTTPLTDSGVDVVKRRYYRYWKGTFNASTNPGHDDHLKYVFDAEGVRNYDFSSDGDIADADLRAASSATLEPYAAAYFEYDSSHRINKFWLNGECNCSGSANGTHFLEYEDNPSYSNDTSAYDEDEFLLRTIVQRPDGSYVTQYFDEVLQPLSRVITDADPDNTNPSPSFWATYVDRNSKGVITEVSTPANVSERDRLHALECQLHAIDERGPGVGLRPGRQRQHDGGFFGRPQVQDRHQRQRLPGSLVDL